MDARGLHDRAQARVASRFKKTEKVGKAQLVLFLDALQRGEGEPETEAEEGGPDEIDEADEKLRAASGANDLKNDAELAAVKPRRRPQPESKLPDTSKLPHVPNPLLVPKADRAWKRSSDAHAGSSERRHPKAKPA